MHYIAFYGTASESESSGNGCGLRPHRDVGADWEGGAGLQRVGHGAAPLVRHAGQPAAPHRAVAHPQGPRRWREEGLNTSAVSKNGRFPPLELARGLTIRSCVYRAVFFPQRQTSSYKS